jgi:hypothetical protein
MTKRRLIINPDAKNRGDMDLLPPLRGTRGNVEPVALVLRIMTIDSFAAAGAQA